MKDNDIPIFLAQAFAQAPKGTFSLRQKQQAADISEFVGADLFGLYLLERELFPLATLVAPPKEKMVNEYEYYRHQDPLFHYLLQQGGAVEGVELLGEEQWLRNPIGQMLQRWQMRYTIQGAISIEGRIVGTLNFARAPDAGRFCPGDTAKVAALCHEVSRLLVSRAANREALSEQQRRDDWPADSFITSPKIEATEALCLSDAQGELLPSQSDVMTALGFSPKEFKQLIEANIQAMQADSHQLVERRIFTPAKNCFSLTTLPLPGADPHFITIVKSVREESSPSQPSAPPAFGERTRQALDLLLRGYSNKLIAREMGVSENTVKDHIKRIYRQFGVTNRTELSWRLRRNQGH